jgi:hypothetical protein
MKAQNQSFILNHQTRCKIMHMTLDLLLKDPVGDSVGVHEALLGGDN